MDERPFLVDIERLMKKGVPHAPEHAWQSPMDPPPPYSANSTRNNRGGNGYGNGGYGNNGRANNALKPVSGGLYRTSAFDRDRKRH